MSSCNKEEVPIALARLRHEGAVVTTSESFIYECVGDAEKPEYVPLLYFNGRLTVCRFKQLIKLVKESGPSTKDALQTLCKI